MKALLVLTAGLVLALAACSGQASGTWRHVERGETFINFLDGEHFETDKYTGTCRVDGNKITFTNTVGIVSRGEFKGESLIVERSDMYLVRGGEYRRE